MLNGRGLVVFVYLAVLFILWCKPMEIIAQEECKDIFSSSTCKDQERRGACRYAYTLKNCRKTCKNCTIATTSPPTQVITTKVTTTSAQNCNLSTTPLINSSATTITKHYYTNNNTYTHSGSLCRCAPTSLVTAVFLWTLGNRLGLVG